MAMDITMTKGDMTIKVSPDFREYYEKKVLLLERKIKNIS